MARTTIPTGGGAILHKRVVLTHDQLIHLRGSAVTLVDVPGKIIEPILVHLLSKIDTPYSSIGANSQIQIIQGVGENLVMEAPENSGGNVSGMLTYNAVGAIPILFLPPVTQLGNGAEDAVGPLKIQLDNSSELTAGASTNQLAVDVYYSVIDPI